VTQSAAYFKPQLIKFMDENFFMLLDIQLSLMKMMSDMNDGMDGLTSMVIPLLQENEPLKQKLRDILALNHARRDQLNSTVREMQKFTKGLRPPGSPPGTAA
jgi:hypothetical protein